MAGIVFSEQEMEIIHLGIAVLATGVSAFIGVLVGSFLVVWRKRAARKRAYFRDQLRNFYSPLLALHDEVRVFQNTVTSGGFSTQHESDKKDLFARLKPDDEKDILQYQLLPAYERMLELFRANMWLVDEDTRHHYPVLFRFVHDWRRVIAQGIAQEPLDYFQRSEKQLDDFFQCLHAHHKKLQKQFKRA